MARKKISLQYIANASARKQTFRKRKQGLKKKVSELSTLCGVEACIIMYGPDNMDVELWPEGPECEGIIEKFKSIPEMEQSKKMMNQEAFINHKITNLQQLLKKHTRETREAEMTLVMNEGLAGKSFNHLSLADLIDLDWLVGLKLKEIRDRMKVLEASTTLIEGPEKAVTVEDSLTNLQKQTWFLDAMNPGEQIVSVADMHMQFPEMSQWLNSYYDY